MLLSSLLAVMMTAFFSTAVKTRKTMGVRIEVQQGLRVLLSTNSTADVANGTQELSVSDGTIFDNSYLLYVTPDGATGDYYTIASTTPTTVTLNEPLLGTHPPNSGIYAVDERIYEIGTVSGRDALTVALDGSSPYPLIDGVQAFNLEYHISPCDIDGCASIVDLPADAAQWRLVHKIAVSTTVKSHKEDQDGQFVYETGEISVRTRNFL
jgi:hypothetical protein